MDDTRQFENPDAQRVEGNWKMFKGYLREKWGELTDDELEKRKGQREQLLGYLQERTAADREELERDLEDLMTRAHYAW